MNAEVRNPGGRMTTRDAEVIASRMFAQVFRAYMECSGVVQEVIRDMVEIVNDCESTPEETDAALLTIAEALFPSRGNGLLGADLESCETDAPDHVRTEWEEADSQERIFAERLGTLLREKGMKQSELAALIGVGQPAISMMLSRNCRPQKRTVESIARALEVEASDLWPAYEEV